MSDKKLELMTVGGGCFWCIEAIFNEVNGVQEVVSGYMGGTVPGTPTYREVCSGWTGHAEVVQVNFNPSVISYEDLLIIFMTSHDPTTLNGQGADVGTQYRSVIFYHNDKQKQIAELVANEIAPFYEKPIMTEISPLETFHKAEDVHQNYYANNQTVGYCSAVITPKLIRLRKMHADKIIQPARFSSFGEQVKTL
ncbi:peptide-methionine (S)-S-oxide reductase MsrA [Gelidibacter sp.]|uniref:peptide-methionine (S)-S-oxide reductase MsrA n=1 Tax=Gelidibacter sp. TaxID=2018083 RepID=UPI002D0B41D4|nr:peptide-methionine (S)-S-oxide reductase MsrA [Gelidibacter sp.]HUH27647.1 peptide-methionine (S)-S-oxide reductase MsrA [Gelidibacter sp.]